MVASLRLITYVPAPGTGTREKMETLLGASTRMPVSLEPRCSALRQPGWALGAGQGTGLRHSGESSGTRMTWQRVDSP